MTKNRTPLLIAQLALLATSCLGLAACNGDSSVGAKEAAPPEVGVLTLEPQSVRLSAELPGRTSAYLVAEVRPQVGGILLQRQFQEGSQVKAGQVLYQIDPATRRATLARAEASMEASQLLARRYEKLIQTHAISQQQYDDARLQFLEAKAAADSARIELSFTRITAPISGRVGRSSVTQGALVTANQSDALATVQQLDPIYVDIVQPSSTLMRLKAALADGSLKRIGNNQAEVHLTLDDGRQYEHAGKLQFSEVSVDESTGAVTLRAVFPNPDSVLLPGMFVRAQLQEGIRDQALLVPQRGITRDTQGRATALVLDANDKAELRTVVTERSIDGKWLVSKGLEVGDRLIVDGVQNVQPGMKVKAVQASAPESSSAHIQARS